MVDAIVIARSTLLPARPLTPVENRLIAAADKGTASMPCREFHIAESSLLAEIAGREWRMPASSKTTAKTTTKTV